MIFESGMPTLKGFRIGDPKKRRFSCVGLLNSMVFRSGTVNARIFKPGAPTLKDFRVHDPKIPVFSGREPEIGGFSGAPGTRDSKI